MAVADLLSSKAKGSKEVQNLGAFAGFLFSTRDIAHQMHLATKSFAEHKALDDYYNDIVDLVDGIVESSQGKYGLLTISVPALTVTPNDCVGTFTSFANTVQTMRSTLPQDSYIQNQIDEVEALIYSTIYKLKNLK